jgi:acetylornithine deacetylase
MNAIQILDKLIQLNTVNDQQNKEIMTWLADFLQPQGFKIQLVKNKTSGKLSLLAKYNQKKNPVLTFCGHTDTVPAGTNWTKDPFKLTAEGEKLFGLGSCDMKGGIAAFLAAVSQTDLSSLKKGLNLLFTYDEEINFSGVIEFLKKVKLKTKYIIIAEPTDLAPQSAAKGVVSVQITFLGKEAHGGSPEKGINAICLAGEFITKAKAYFVNLQKQKNLIFANPCATLNIAQINGGDAINKVPAKCQLNVEYRTIKDSQASEIYQGLLQILRQMDCQFKIKITLQTPPLFVKNSKFIKEAEEITGKKTFGTNGSNEGSYFSQAGYDCIVIGPGSDMAHQPNEFVLQNDLLGAQKIYQQLINKYCK